MRPALCLGSGSSDGLLDPGETEEAAATLRHAGLMRLRVGVAPADGGAYVWVPSNLFRVV